jgi:hypothetical protein
MPHRKGNGEQLARKYSGTSDKPEHLVPGRNEESSHADVIALGCFLR